VDADTVNLEIELLIKAIYTKFQYDFRQYSRSSLRRRLEQALVKFDIQSISELQARILHDNDFFPKIIPYLTVNTTEMFRDPTYFLALKEKVFPVLKTFPSIKVWIAGCSTGEEVVSLAILLRESGFKKYLIYATDINPMNLEAARRGIYSAETVRKASINYHLAGGEHHLSDYYNAAYESVQFEESLYKNIVFSDHSLSTDAVFSETHLISCRNVLIYFDRALQERVFKLFSESLTRGTFLGLGSKETLQFSEVFPHFDTIDPENKIYKKKEGYGL
jgi:chemotaxis protein methyltransferase CheR